MSDSLRIRPASRPRAVLGTGVVLLGFAALAAPMFWGKVASFVLGLLLLAGSMLQLFGAFGVRGRTSAGAWRFTAAMSAVAGILLLLQPSLLFAALAVLLGLSWFADGVVKAATALRSPDQPGFGWAALDGAFNALLGVFIAIQWPISGLWSIAIYVGLRMISSGWAMIFGGAGEAISPSARITSGHPDARLGLLDHPELTSLRERFAAEEVARQQTDRYWRWMFVLTFFAIHVGRMEAEWNLIGLAAPAVAVFGDVVFALFIGYLIVMPLGTLWRTLTRPLERRGWASYLSGLDRGRRAGPLFTPLRGWLTRRMRFAYRASEASWSATAAVGRGLQVGLPVTAIIIAINPVWGLSWYFNTENWATAVWEKWAAYRTDDWREQMVRAVRVAYAAPDDDTTMFRVVPAGLDASSGDFSFIVIGDPGEGDASQHILRDRYLSLGAREDVKFLVVSSDVIYPSGAMRHYEPNFYLPFKGFSKPIYAVPGNHDWYDALEAFTANFLEPPAARAAMRGRREADHKLTTTTETRIDLMIEDAARLRREYGISAALQRAPYFHVATERFVLIVVDTGILRSIDEPQMRWLRAVLDESDGKFRMVILGHPLYAAGHYQAADDPAFAELHRLLREHRVEVVMAGDTHTFEYYREPYSGDGESGQTLHFVNGGGGAYLSIGTALAWPHTPPVADCAFYPRTDQLTAKLDRETPLWKRPIWWWVKRLGAWPSSPEALAAAFDFNRAPFFQSFVEVSVEDSADVVRLRVHGAAGPLRWRDLQLIGQVMPEGEDLDAAVEFRAPLPTRDTPRQ